MKTIFYDISLVIQAIVLITTLPLAFVITMIVEKDERALVSHYLRRKKEND